ncbi:MAG: hypothetical protein FJ009_06100 [Chloroflexi bacterium]|nr:hypothetical protein [Chloroflexota bacterium]
MGLLANGLPMASAAQMRLKHLLFTYLRYLYGDSFAKDPILGFFFGDWLEDAGVEPAIPRCVVELEQKITYPKPTFWNAENFLEALLAYRLVWLKGRLGGGKTSLAFGLAKWLYETKGKDGHRLVDGVFTNVPSDPDFIPRLDHCYRACVILDEGWAHGADSRDSGFRYSGYGAYARKLDCFWLQASKNEIDKRMTDVIAKRRGDLWMFKAWLYTWTDGEASEGWFLWRRYTEVFGRYLTKFIPADDGGILESQKYEIAGRAGSTQLLVPTGWYNKPRTGAHA